MRPMQMAVPSARLFASRTVTVGAPAPALDAEVQKYPVSAFEEATTLKAGHLERRLGVIACCWHNPMCRRDHRCEAAGVVLIVESDKLHVDCEGNPPE
jgi:hypothetical protein